MTAAPPLRLAEITADSLWPILQLRVAPAQRGFVAENATSIAQAHFEPAAWFRGLSPATSRWASPCCTTPPCPALHPPPGSIRRQ